MAWRLSWSGHVGTSAQTHDACQEQRSSAADAAHCEGHPAAGTSKQARSGGEPGLEHRWLSTRPPPRRGLRPRSAAQGHVDRTVEHRQASIDACLACPSNSVTVSGAAAVCDGAKVGHPASGQPHTNIWPRQGVHRLRFSCRYMAVTAFAGLDDGSGSEGLQRISIVAASSEAVLQLLELDVGSKRQGCLMNTLALLYLIIPSRTAPEAQSHAGRKIPPRA